jgi:hypothetical protein
MFVLARRLCEVVGAFYNSSHTNRVTRPLPIVGPYSLDCPLLARPGLLGCTIGKECSFTCSSRLESSRLRYATGKITSNSSWLYWNKHLNSNQTRDLKLRFVKCVPRYLQCYRDYRLIGVIDTVMISRLNKLMTLLDFLGALVSDMTWNFTRSDRHFANNLAWWRNGPNTGSCWADHSQFQDPRPITFILLRYADTYVDLLVYSNEPIVAHDQT